MFSNAIKLATVSGFDIKVDPSWALIAALVTWTLSQQYFPATLPDQTSQMYVVMAVVAMLSFFGSLLLHELAHSVVARRFGVQIKGITLFLFGGVAELAEEPKSATAEFWIALAGPAMSLSLSAVFWLLAQLSVQLLNAPAVIETLSYLAAVNLVIALFNLVPAFPLDGGRVLRAYLWHRHGDILRATKAAARSGTIFAYGLMFLGVLVLFQGLLITGLWYIMIGFFVLGAARGAYQSQIMDNAFAGKTVGNLMVQNPIVVSPEMTLSDFVNTVVLSKRVSFVPVVEDGILLGQIDKDVLSVIDHDNWSNTCVGDVFAGLDVATTVPPDMPISDLMAQIAQTGTRKFLVVKDHTLLGVITLANLIGYMHTVENMRRVQYL